MSSQEKKLKRLYKLGLIDESTSKRAKELLDDMTEMEKEAQKKSESIKIDLRYVISKFV